MKLLIDGDFSLWTQGFDCDDGLGLIEAINTSDVKAVTCVGGNSSVDNSVSNALKITQLTKEVPIYRGRDPKFNTYTRMLLLLKRLVSQKSYVVLPHPNALGDSLEAFNKFHKSVDKAVFLGPLTNLMNFKGSFKELILMGGAFNIGGNITPFAEFNSFLDAPALDSVSNKKITIMPLDVTSKAVVTSSFLKRFTGELSHISKFKLMTLHDPLTVTYALKPEFFTTRKIGLKVITYGVMTGRTIETKGDNVTLITGFDRDKFLKFFKESLSNRFYV